MLVIALFVFALISHPSVADSNATCLATLQSITRNGGPSALLQFYGCVDPRHYGYPARNINGTMPTTAQADACATQCQNQFFDESEVQFMWLYGQCACLGRLTDQSPSDEVAQCDVQQVPLLDLQVDCPLNVSICGLAKYCAVQNGCCVPSADSTWPNYYSGIIQWVALVVVVLALLEAVVYCVVKRRARARQAQLERELGVNLVSRDKAECLLIARVLAANFETLVATESSPLRPSGDDGEAHCTICLEPLSSGTTLIMNCKHQLHKPCLEEFIAHSLLKENTVSCPMCRKQIVSEGDVAQAASSTNI